MTHLIATAADADIIRDDIETFASEMWATSDAGRVDWEEWADRFEQRHPDIDLGDSFLSPGFKAVKRIARNAIAEAIGG